MEVHWLDGGEHFLAHVCEGQPISATKYCLKEERSMLLENSRIVAELEEGQQAFHLHPLLVSMRYLGG